MKRTGTLILVLAIASSLFAQYDWDNTSVPAEKRNSDYTWELIEELSDDFNYESPSAQDMGAIFYSKWKDGFFNAWTGPGNTYWTPDASIVTGGNLEITATRKTGDIVYFQAVTAKKKVLYPVYVETRMKVMNSVMANAVWMLSENSSEEIDIVEAYGSDFSESANKSQKWFAQRMHLSHHTFDRSVNPVLDYQPSTASGSYYYDGTYWKDNFRTVGVYWKDPFHLEYYIDGSLVRTVSGADMIDPNEYLDGNGLSKEETIIISGAAQAWQVAGGVYPTDNELSVTADNIFKIDWIRAYQRMDATPINEIEISDQIIYSNPVGAFITIKSDAQISEIELYNMSGQMVKPHFNRSLSETQIATADLKSGIYIMKVTEINGNISSAKIVK